MPSFGRAFSTVAGSAGGCDNLRRFEGDDEASVVDTCFGFFVLSLFFSSLIVVGSSHEPAGQQTKSTIFLSLIASTGGASNLFH